MRGLWVAHRPAGPAPAWARQDNALQNAPPDRLEDYGDFVYESVRHYRGRIGHIQIWNEPNIYPEWGNRPVDPAEYVEMLKIAYRRAKEADPNVYVLSAPLAFTLGEPHPERGRWRSMNDLTYLEGMYQAGAGAVFDILSTNAFGMDRPPEDPPDPNVLNFQRVLLQREIMVRYGDADKPVWFNEYGWNAAPSRSRPTHCPEAGHRGRAGRLYGTRDRAGAARVALGGRADDVVLSPGRPHPRHERRVLFPDGRSRLYAAPGVLAVQRAAQ